MKDEGKDKRKDNGKHKGKAGGKNKDQLIREVLELRQRVEELEACEEEARRAGEALRKSEEQLRQRQKVEALGRLAGGVAHDFNNLLMTIKNCSMILLNGFAPGDPRREDLEEIQKAAERATDLTRQLLAFGRVQVLQPQVLNLNGVITGMNKMFTRLIGEDIELVTFLDPGLGSVRVDRGQIEQVLMNLILNARDAMPGGGKITVETTNVELDEPYARRHISVRPGPFVLMAVSDEGCGMDPETLSQVFEPFFTTKAKGEGSGLGLSTVYGIVKQSGGNIWAYSEKEKGSCFKVYLPRIEEEAAQPQETTHSAPAPAGGTDTILLVEDNEAVRKMMAQDLEGSGYSVLEAMNGEEALRISTEYGHPIHLLVTDVIMPKMSGRELAERLKPSRQEMQVLYISGYPDKTIGHHGILEKGTAFLQKPFTMDDLERKVRQILDTPRKET